LVEQPHAHAFNGNSQRGSHLLDGHSV
jgi:hypothetical protein